MRFLIDLSDEELTQLDALAQRNGRSRAAEVREAIRAWMQDRSSNDWIMRGGGYWKDRGDIIASTAPTNGQ